MGTGALVLGTRNLRCKRLDYFVTLTVLTVQNEAKEQIPWDRLICRGLPRTAWDFSCRANRLYRRYARLRTFTSVKQRAVFTGTVQVATCCWYGDNLNKGEEVSSCASSCRHRGKP